MAEPEIDAHFQVIAETSKYVAVSKSGNCPVHEGGRYEKNCLTALLEHKYGYRLFPVYRLDRETSGIVVFAKSAAEVKEIFDSITYKEYIAICKGNLESAQLIDKPIGECKGTHIQWKKCIASPEAGCHNAREARTFVEPIMQPKRGTVIIKAIPMTGRQHQIRVHLSSIGCPIVGDKIYGESDCLFKDYLEGRGVAGRQLLHLHKVSIGEDGLLSPLPTDIEAHMHP